MKTSMTTIGLLVLAAVVLVFTSAAAFGQPAAEKWVNEEQLYQKKSAEDVNNELHIFKTRTLLAWLEDANQVFQRAEEDLRNNDQKELLHACREVRKKGLVLKAFWEMDTSKPSEFISQALRECGIEPSFHARIPLLPQIKFQALYVRAFDNLVDAMKKYSDVLDPPRNSGRRPISVQTKIDVAVAISEARGKQYEAEHCNGLRKDHLFNFGRTFYDYLFFSIVAAPPAKGESACPPGIGAVYKARELKGWSNFFRRVSVEDGKKLEAGTLRSIGQGNMVASYELKLALSGGPGLGSNSPGREMPSREELLLVLRPADLDQAWNGLFSPQPPQKEKELEVVTDKVRGIVASLKRLLLDLQQEAFYKSIIRSIQQEAVVVAKAVAAR